MQEKPTPKAKGRPSIKTTPVETVEFTQQVHDEIHQNAALVRQVDAGVQAIAAQQFESAKIMGQIEAMNVIQKFTATGNIVLFKQVKDSKAYRGMLIPQADGTTRTLNTFEDFCEVMGTSASKVYEDIQNLNIFGEAFLESANRLGLGYRDLRRLRTLPDEDRTLIIEGEKVGNDPEALKDLLEELSIKRSKDKEAIKEIKADKDALEKVLAKKNKDLDKTQTELAKFTNLPPDQRILAQAEKENAALKDLHSTGLQLLGLWQTFLAQGHAIFNLENVSDTARDLVNNLASGLCAVIADDLLEYGFDVDLKAQIYPAELQDLTQKTGE